MCMKEAFHEKLMLPAAHVCMLEPRCSCFASCGILEQQTALQFLPESSLVKVR